MKLSIRPQGHRVESRRRLGGGLAAYRQAVGRISSMRQPIFLLLTLAANSGRPPVSVQDQSAARLVLPDSLKDWSVRKPDAIDWDASGRSTDEWYVRVREGRLIVSDRPEEEADTLPFKIKPIPRRGETELAGRRHVLVVEDGYLVGFDAGEFGGSAWWFSGKGDRWQKLTLRAGSYFPENVHAFAVLGKDVLAFEGLTHMFTNHGRIVRLHHGSDGDWHASLFANLSACPRAVLQLSERTWLFATTTGVFTIDAEARARALWEPRGVHLYYPNSLVRDEAGTVYMGMRSFVVRMAPQSGAYVVDVLVPPNRR